MKFSVAAVVGLLLSEHQSLAFSPVSSSFSSTGQRSTRSLKTAQSMATMDTPPSPPPPENNLPVITQNAYGQPSDVRYSDFLKLVNADKIEKVTFSADGTQLLGVNVDGARLKIESLPNDPDLLSQLTTHKVCIYICIYIVYIYVVWMCEREINESY
jgi:cell division protease FtsH